jgi:hypothetical protein
VDLVGACIMGQDQHWELLPAQAAFSARVGSIIQGFQAFPSFPAVSFLSHLRFYFIICSSEVAG